MSVLDYSFKQFCAVILCLGLRGKFIFTNIKRDSKMDILLDAMRHFGVEFILTESTLDVKSFTKDCLKAPSKSIDIKGESALLYGLCGLLSGLDYTIFFEDSTQSEKSFSPLILSLYDAGVRFEYSPNFTMPLSMKGTTNLIPLEYEVLTENYNLLLAFILMGIGGIGITKLKSSTESLKFFTKILAILKANVKNINDAEISVTSLKQNIIIEAQIDLEKL